MKRGKSERGQAELLVGVLITAALLGSLMIFPIGQDLYENSRAWQKERKEAVAGYATVWPIIGPPLPAGGKAHDCTLKVAKSHNLEWTDRGWRAPTINPEPTLTYDAARDKGIMDAWKEQMDSYIATFQFEFERCLQPELAAPDLDNLPAEASEVARNWGGTYALDVQSQSAACLGAFPDRLSASQSGSAIRITLQFPGAAFNLEGPLSSDNAFDITKTETRGENSITVTTRIRGRFDSFGDQRLIRSGYFETSSDGDSCTAGFEGRSS